MVDAGGISVYLALSTAFRLTLVVVVAGNIEEEVHGPAEQLLSDRVEEGSDWSLLSQLVQFVDHLPNTTRILFSSLGNKDHVTLEVSGGLVVFAMGNFPREVGNQKC